MTKPFYAEPILNSPYEVPTRHHALSASGEPLDHPPIEGRRRSEYIAPVPKSRRSKGSAQKQTSLDLDQQDANAARYNLSKLINEIRGHVESWRRLPNPADWGVTPTTQRLLQHWRHHSFSGPRPFFCQVEAVETAIWLAEVARNRKQYAHIFRHLEEANQDANPDLFRIALKLATGAGKLPRVPVSDNSVNSAMPVYRNLWDHIGKDMPKKGAGKSGDLDPFKMPSPLQTALYSLYSHYEKEYEAWEKAGIGVPPVFIVVCNNTASSKLVYEWISGWEREVEGERQNKHKGHLKLFSNFDQYGNPLARMNTLLIDSQQLESGEALDANFRDIAALELERFRREKAEREGAAEADKLSDTEILREVMNTVGQKGRLGEQIRCVVSVSMLTEGWDANTVTHILGVRAFGTQLLCEQVIGRGLRRQSYELNDKGLFNTEYADILGIPFDFATEPQEVVRTPPKPVTRVHAMKERANLSIRFPRVAGYRTELPSDRFSASFNEDSVLTLTPELVGPCKVRLEGLVGEGHDISPDALNDMRPNTVAIHLTKKLIELYFRETDQDVPYYLYNQLQPITRRWVNECLKLTGGTKAGMLTYAELAEKACELIYQAIVRSAGEDGTGAVKAMLDPYNRLVFRQGRLRSARLDDRAPDLSDQPGGTARPPCRRGQCRRFDPLHAAIPVVGMAACYRCLADRQRRSLCGRATHGTQEPSRGETARGIVGDLRRGAPADPRQGADDHRGPLYRRHRTFYTPRAKAL